MVCGFVDRYQGFRKTFFPIFRIVMCRMGQQVPSKVDVHLQIYMAS
jgi:hypothetical protein